MDKITQLFFHRVTQLQDKLQGLLEKDLQTSPISTTTNPFSPSMDLSQLDSLGLGLPADTENRMTMLFSRLSSYFESGLLFHKQIENWKATAGFQEGLFLPFHRNDFPQTFNFPEMTLVEVRRVSSPKIFAEFKKLDLLTSDDSHILIFKPHPDYIFLVTSRMEETWLKRHIESIQKEVLLLVSDIN